MGDFFESELDDPESDEVFDSDDEDFESDDEELSLLLPSELEFSRARLRVP